MNVVLLQQIANIMLLL